MAELVPPHRVCYVCLSEHPNNRDLLRKQCLTPADHKSTVGRLCLLQVRWNARSCRLEPIKRRPYLCTATSGPQTIPANPSETGQAVLTQQPPAASLKLSPDLSGHNRSVPFKECFRERVKEVELSLATIEEPLSVSNYKQKFNHLICWEEREHINILGKRCDGQYELVLYDQDHANYTAEHSTQRSHKCFGHIQGLDVHQLAYVARESEAAVIVSDRLPAKEVRADLLGKNIYNTDNKLHVAFNSSDVKQLQGALQQVEFELKHSTFDTLICSVNALPDDVIQSKLLPVSSNFQSPVLDYGTLSPPEPLDKQHQLSAWMKIVSNSPNSPPVLVCGSSGSGKTHVLAMAAYSLIKLGRKPKMGKKAPVYILLCAHHQTSADMFLEKYFGKMVADQALDVDLIRLVPTDYSYSSKQYKTFYISLECFGKHCIKSSRCVVITTFCTSRQLFDVCGRNFFTHIFLDEVAQVREPEALIPLCMASAKTSLVVAGDSCQVGPSLLVHGEEARQNGLMYSLLDRLMTHYQDLKTVPQNHIATLRTNYRCHTEILAVPQQLFYGPRLECKGPHSTHPLATYPLRFVCSSVYPDIQTEAVGNGAMEARLLFEEAERLIDPLHWPEEWGLFNLEDICFVTATLPQVMTLRKIANAEYKRFQKAKFLTTDSIQGQEFRALFLSTYEDCAENGKVINPTQSCCDRYVFNTLITRAKSLVVSIGNPLFLLKIEEKMVMKYGESAGRCWSSYLSRCLDNKTVQVPKTVIVHSRAKKRFKSELSVLVSNKSTEAQKTATVALREIAFQALKAANARPVQVMPQKQPRNLTSLPEKNTVSIMQTNRASPAVLLKNQPLVKLSKADVAPTHTRRQVNQTPQSVVPSTITNLKKRGQMARVSSDLHRYSQIESSLKEDSLGSVPHVTLSLTDYPTLTDAAKVTNRAVKALQQSKVNLEATDGMIGHSKYFKDHMLILDDDDSLLQSELTLENYKEKFHHLLCWEEKEHHRLLSESSNGEYSITVFQKGYIPGKRHGAGLPDNSRYGYISSLETHSGDIMSNISQAGMGVYIELDKNISVYASFFLGKGIIPNCADANSIGLKFSEDESDKLIKCKRRARGWIHFNASVKYELKHTYFQRMHETIERLPQAALSKILLNAANFEGNITKSIMRVPFIQHMNLDDDQFQALIMALGSSCNVPFLIVGPFGTGKTRVLARAAVHILQNSRETRVLICAHHQTSADTFVEYFGSCYKGLLRGCKMIRLIPLKRYASTTYDKYHDLYKTSRQIHNMKQFRLIVTTLGTAPHLQSLSDKTGNFFTHILIDEGAQAREPEMLGPLCFVNKNTKIIIAGDHCQVGPQLLVRGEKARENGLATSLLERLHRQYEVLDASRNHNAALLQNYRCHSGILMLASSLFYRSTLQCRVPDTSADPQKAYPLQFFCSSLDSAISDVVDSVNHTEAMTLLNQVDLLVQSWPTRVWGDLDLSQICVMTPSPNQKSYIHGLVYRGVKYKQLRGIEILKAYEIQGREFRAVFIGTSEVCFSHIPKYPTKSMCDRFVFNTAITRSQSLVVAVGNPFLLMSIEEGSEHLCWKEYLRRCIEYRTFNLPSNESPLPSDIIENLLKKIYYNDDCSNQAYVTSLHGDSILTAYTKQFENIPQCKATKLALSTRNCDLVWNFRTQVVDESDILQTNDQSEAHSEQSVEYSDRYECTLSIKTIKNTVGIPLDSTKNIVEIKGLKNRRGAFDGDKVLIGVFRDSPEGKCYGKVIDVIAHFGELKFLCVVHCANSIQFAPIDKKSPIIVNLPCLSRDLISKKNMNTLTSELSSLDVVVFAPDSISQIKEGFLPQIKRVIPLSVARHMVFLVCVLKWNLSYRYPLGVVIEAFPKGYTAFEAERLLTTMYSVAYNTSETSEEINATSTHTKTEVSLPYYDRCFTIDPENAENLDDALSLVCLSENVYELAVHITNVALNVPEGSETDCSAREKGLSFYGGEDRKIMHMLPMDTRKRLSLKPNEDRDVLSVIAIVKTENNVIQFLETRFKQALVRSSIQLTYKLAQVIMDESSENIIRSCSTQLEKFNAGRNDQPSLSATLKLLYQMAVYLRSNRLGSECALCYEVSDSEVECWQAHLLVEEFMIWANAQVAEYLYNTYSNNALLRCQAGPNQKDMAALVGLYNPVMGHSPLLSRNFTENPCNQSLPLMVPSCLVEMINKAISDSDLLLLVHLITTDRLYPQLACVKAQFQSVQCRAEYCCTSVKEEPSRYQHFSLQCGKYTHFTSPMRRYFDVEVQRMLMTLLNRCVTNYAENQETLTRDKNIQLCLDLNRRTQNKVRFENGMAAVQLAQRLVSGSEEYIAFLIPSKNKGELEFYFPKSKLNEQIMQKRLKVKYFGPFVRKKGTDTEHCFNWRCKITSNSELGGMKILYNSNFDEVKETREAVKKSMTCPHEMCINLGAYYCSEQERQVLKAKNFTATVAPELIPISSDARQAALNCVHNPSSENLGKLKGIFGSLCVQSFKESCPVKLTSPFVIYNLTRTLAHYDSVRVWISWSTREAFLSPCIQLVKLAPGVHICIQHNISPAGCFASQILSNASKMKYRNVEEYVSLWEKVLLAEAAQKSVQESELIIITDVSLKWPDLIRPSNTIDQTTYYEPQGMVYFELRSCHDFFKFEVGDLVCIRYGTECGESGGTRAVFHMVIQKCEEGKVFMKCMEVNCRVSEELKSQISSPCEIQLIPLSTPHQRVYKRLMKMKQSNDSSRNHDQRPETVHVCSGLSVHVALGDIEQPIARYKVPECELAERILKCDPIAQTLWNAETKLNPVQIKAIKLTFANCFQLIQGPPGTGKSETGAHLAYVFAMLNRKLNEQNKGNGCVLYCGPSNKSVDVVLEKFDVVLKKVNLKILRLYSRGIERKSHPHPGSFHQETDQQYVCPTFAHKYALHKLIRSGKTSASRELMKLEEHIASLPKNCVLSPESNRKLKLAIKSAEKAALTQHYDIVFCTCNEASSRRVPKPRQCIVDESGMAYEPECIVPLSLCDHAVLLGDHKQLQPVIDYQPAKEQGLSVSLFERYAGPPFTEILTIQYRMHEKICEFPSKQFYDNKLQTAEEVRHRSNTPGINMNRFWIDKASPILFCDIVGEEDQTIKESKRNHIEAGKVVEIAVVLIKKHCVKMSSIALLTPYTAQKELLKKIAEARNIYKEGVSEAVRIVSVTESQGDEYDIVILSTVRSMPLAEICSPKHVQADRGWLLQNLGFLTDEHQVNVGITRSKYGLVIVGNRKLLEYNDTWKNLIKFYNENGCIKDGRGFPNM